MWRLLLVVLVLVVQASAKIVREVYVGVVLDRNIGLPIVMACAEGGVEIEEVAARTPEKILKTAVDPTAGLHPFQARRLAYELEFPAAQAPKAEALMTADNRGDGPWPLTIHRSAGWVRTNPLPPSTKSTIA